MEEQGGWFVVNVKDARWYGSEDFGQRCSFEMEGSFPEVGVGISVLEPGKPACRYHRENAQENFLVLFGECRLLVNGEERTLKQWDFVHFPPGVTHVAIGAGDGPCGVLMLGHRPADHQLFYPAHETAKQHNAQAPEPTSDPKVAYSDIAPRTKIDAPPWPPE